MIRIKRSMSLSGFSNYMERVDRGILECLHDPPRPTDLDSVDSTSIAEAEVGYSARLREIATCWVYLLNHYGVPHPNPHQGTNRVAVAAGSRQSERHVVRF